MLIFIAISIGLLIVLFGVIPLCAGWLAKILVRNLTGRD